MQSGSLSLDSRSKGRWPLLPLPQPQRLLKGEGSRNPRPQLWGSVTLEAWLTPGDTCHPRQWRQSEVDSAWGGGGGQDREGTHAPAGPTPPSRKQKTPQAATTQVTVHWAVILQGDTCTKVPLHLLSRQMTSAGGRQGRSFPLLASWLRERGFPLSVFKATNLENGLGCAPASLAGVCHRRLWDAP